LADEESELFALAVRVTDGTPVDWDGAAATAGEEERRVIRQLETVARIASVCSDDEGEIAPQAPSPVIPSWRHLRLLQKVGAGGFAEVYRAWDPRLDREVALKLLAPGVAETALEEARLLARIRHTNVVTVHGADISEGRVGIWMELVRGKTLSELQEQQGLSSPREASLIAIDLCRALAAVHAAGFIHGDVKAQNVMREDGGRIVLMDLGIGRDLRHGLVSAGGGTRPYVAPEVMAGSPPTKTADIYALGVLLYRLVTNAYPFEWPAVDEPQPLSGPAQVLLRDRRPDLPEGFIQVVERALAAGPSLRFPTAGAMEAALALWLGLDGLGREPAPPGVPPPATDPSDRLEYLEHIAAGIPRLCDGAQEDELLARLSTFVAEGGLMCQQLAASCFSRDERGDHQALLLSLGHLAEAIDRQLVSGSAKSPHLDGYRLHIRKAVLEPAENLLRYLVDDAGGDAGSSFFLFLEPPSRSPGEMIVDDLLSGDELRCRDAVSAIAGPSALVFVQELRSRSGAERDAILTALWPRADLLILEGKERSRPVFDAAVELALHPEPSERWRSLYRFFRAGTADPAAEATALLGGLSTEDGRVFLRAFLLHPDEVLRRLALERLDPSDLWEIVTHPGTPAQWLVEIWRCVRRRGVAPGFLKVFFVCVRDQIASPGSPERVVAVIEMLKEFYLVDAFHEDTFFKMLLQLDERVRMEGRRHGLLVDFDADYVARVRRFLDEGPTRDQPIESWAAVPLPIQRRVARLGYFMKYFVCHPIDPIALECLAHLVVLQNVTDYVCVASINARLLAQLAKEKQLFLREDARYALAANPKTPAAIVHHYVRLLTRNSLRKLAETRQGNSLARTIAIHMLKKGG
jgi:serine/threonine protein kinase